jgi:hypothetical protein
MSKYLPVNVLCDVDGHDCTLNGVTSRYSTLYVPCEDGYLSYDDIVKRGHEECILVEVPKPFPDAPIRFKPASLGKKHSMMGGRFVYSCDSRYRRAYGWSPLAVHDRVEC